VKTTVEQESQKTDVSFKFMKDKLVKLASQQEQMQSIAEMQQNEVKCKVVKVINMYIEQLQLMMRYLGDISGRATSNSGGGGAGSSAAQQVIAAPV
jgi:hypothetical protein